VRVLHDDEITATLAHLHPHFLCDDHFLWLASSTSFAKAAAYLAMRISTRTLRCVPSHILLRLEHMRG
jgi:hypothetical protein